MRHWIAFLLLAIGLPTGALAQRSTSSPRLPMDSAITVGRLPNGLRYYVRANGRPAMRAELRLVIDAGSVLEDADQRGMAHLLEHMAFNGTTHFPKHELVNYLERIGMRFGADLNAATGFDNTTYMLTVPTDTAALLEQGMQILADWVDGITLDSLETEKERGVVLEEWRLRQGAAGRMTDRLFPVLLRGSRHAERLPIGTKESIQGTPLAAIRRFYEDWYRPDLMAVVVVGDFDPVTIERLIKERFGGVPAAVKPRPRPRYTRPIQAGSASLVITDPEATRTTVAMQFFRPATRLTTEAEYRQRYVDVLHQSMLNGRLAELAERSDPPFISAGGGMQASFARGADMFNLSAVVKDSGVARGLTALATEIARVEQHGFLPAELERTKQVLFARVRSEYAERERLESRNLADEIVGNLTDDEPTPGIAAERALAERILPAITLAEVNRAARAWFAQRDRLIHVQAADKAKPFLPLERSLVPLADRARRAKVAPYRETVGDTPLVAATLAQADIVSESHDSVYDLTTWMLANGVRVILKPTTFKAEEVNLYAWSPGGSSLVPDSLHRAGAFAVAAASTGGLGEFSAIDLRKKLAGKLASVQPWIAGESQGLNGGASPKDLSTLFELVYLHFTAPRADTAAFEALRTAMRNGIVGSQADPARAFRDTITATLSQHHPRMRPMTVEALDSVTLSQAMGVYRDRFADASGFTFVLTGSFAIDSVRPLVRRYLGNLPSQRRGETFRDLGIAPPAGVVERQVYKGLDPKSSVFVAFTGPAVDSLDEIFLAGDVLPNILNLRLTEKLRQEQGGTYSVQANGGINREPSPRYQMTVAFGADPARVDDLLRALHAELESLRRDGPTDEELAKTREMLARVRETELRENGFWLGQIVASVRERRSLKELLALDQQLKLVTKERVQQALARYYQPDRYVQVVLLPDARNAGQK